MNKKKATEIEAIHCWRLFKEYIFFYKYHGCTSYFFIGKRLKQKVWKMAPTISLINQLHPSITTSTFAVRVVRAYEVPFNGNAAEPMSLECILRDFNGVRIHASFRRSLFKSIAVKMIEGHYYLIHKFYARPNHMRYKTTSHALRIVMTEKTEICEIREANFPSEMFAFKPFTEIVVVETIVDQCLFGSSGEEIMKKFKFLN